MCNSFRKKICAVSAFFIIALPSFAISEVQKINIEEAVSIAVQNNTDNEINKLDIKKAANDIKAANRLQNPEFNLFYNFGKAGEGNPQQIGATEVIELGKRGIRKSIAVSNLDITTKDVLLKEFILKTEVKNAYINLVSKKTILSVLLEQEALLKELLNIAKRKVEIGTAAEIDVLQAEMALNKMIADINQAKCDVKTSTTEFNKALNLKSSDIIYDSSDELLSFDDNSLIKTSFINGEIPSFDDIKEKVLENRYDVRIAQNEIVLAKKKLKEVLRQRIPDIEIQAGYAYQNSHTSDDGTFQNGAYVGGSLVNLPFLYSYRPEIKNAKIETEQKELNYISVKNKAEKDLSIAYDNYAAARANLNFYKTGLVENSDEIMRISKRSYEAGKSNLTSLIVMEQSYREVEIGYIEALSNYYISFNNLLKEANIEEYEFSNEDI